MARRRCVRPSLGLFLELGPDGLRVGVDSLEHAPHHPVLERGVQEVLAHQVEVAPLHGLLGSPLQELRRGVGEVLRYVYLFSLPPGSHPTTSAGRSEGLVVEEPAEEVVEQAAAPQSAAPQRGAFEG